MDVLVRPARDRSDYEACVRLQREVWGLSDLEITSVIQLIATVHAGGHLLVADSAEGILGFCYAFAALRGGEGHLHSDMLAVSPRARGLGVGLRLKWAQREEALRRGLRLVTWTFDPMRATNARLNLHHLGAIVPRAPPGLLRHHELRPAPRPGHRPADGPLGARPPARRATRGRRGGERRRGTRPCPRSSRSPGGTAFPSPRLSRLDLDEPALRLEIPADWDAVCAAGAGLGAGSGSRPCARRSSRPSPAATRPRASYRGGPAPSAVRLPSPEGRASAIVPAAGRPCSGPTPRPWRREAKGRTTTRSTSPRRASRAGPTRCRARRSWQAVTPEPQ